MVVTTPGSRWRTSGSISFAYHSTASVLGGCWKPPMNTMPWRSAKGLPSPQSSWMFDSTSTRASGASRCSSSFSTGLTTTVASALRISASSASRFARAAALPSALSVSSASRSSRRKCRSTVSNTNRACGANVRIASTCGPAM